MPVTEPDYIAQNSLVSSATGGERWVYGQALESAKIGVTWYRVSGHHDKPEVLLFEGWKVCPDCAGEARFRFN